MTASVEIGVSTWQHEMRVDMNDLDIRLMGRRWTADEMVRHDDLPGRLDLINGKLCLDDEQRMLLLGALLEHVGTAGAVSLGRLAPWIEAVEQRKEDQAWDSMPAVGAERFWVPQHVSFRKRLQLKECWMARLNKRGRRRCGPDVE